MAGWAVGEEAVVHARVRSFASTREELARRRILVAGMILALLASISVIVPQATPTTLASGGPAVTSVKTYFVSDGSGGTGSGCAAADTSTGNYVDEAGAIQDALNLAATDGTADDVVIHLCPGTFDLSSGISITSGDDGFGTPDTSVTIKGEGTADTRVRLSADVVSPDFALFTVSETETVDTTFRSLTISGARYPSGSGGAIASLASASTVTVLTAWFTDNSSGMSGGAIYAKGSAAISDGTFTANRTHQDGGAIAADVSASIVDSRFTHNSSATGWGGAVYTDTSAELLDSTFESNVGYAYGGAVNSNGTVDATNCTFISNVAVESSPSGGAIYSGSDARITDSEFTDNSAATGGAIYSDARVTTVESTFDRNFAAEGRGGAISAVNVDSGTTLYRDNTTGAYAGGPGGGAIYASAKLTSVRDTFETNSALDGGLGSGVGGAIYADEVDMTEGTVVGNYGESQGGAIFAWLGRIAIDRSTFHANRTGGNGGAFFSYAESGDSVASVTNSTFVDNTAGSLGGDASGGSIFVFALDGNATLEVSQATFVGPIKTAYPSVDGIHLNVSAGPGSGSNHATLEVTDTIFMRGSCTVDASFTTTTTIGATVSNVQSDSGNDCQANVQVTTAAINLGTLGDYGGPTPTVNLLSPSVAIDAIGATCPIATDQRGEPRPSGAGCDAGAYEVQQQVAYIVGKGTGTCADHSSIQAAATAASTGDVVHICEGTYTLTTPVAVVGKDLTFEATAGTATIVDGSGGSRLFTSDSDLTFWHLTLRNAYTTGDGAAVYTTGNVSVSDATFMDNSAGSDGGAIFASGNVSLTDATFRGNSAGEGGAIYSDEGDVTAVRGTFADNTANTGFGGAIWAALGTAVSGTHFDRNSASDSGGAIAATDVTSATAFFTDNTAGIDGGAINADLDVTITGGTFLRNLAAEGSGGTIWATGDVSVTGGSFTDNTAGIGGGAIATDEGGSVTVTGTPFTTNHADAGGAIYSDGPVDISASTFVSNSVDDDGGAVYATYTNPVAVRRSTFSGNTSGAEGGAVYLGGGGSGGPISIEASTFDANSAEAGGAVYGGTTVASVRNSTFYENTANTGDGGAFAVDTVDVTNGTFVRNSAVGNGDQIAALTVTSDDSIFAEGDCQITNTSSSGSITEDATCPGDPTTGTGLNLGGFGNWGGPTKTVKLLSPSDAIDSTPAGSGACLSTTDQRGVARPQGGDCDAGAYEVVGTVLTYTGPSVVYTSGSVANVNLSGTTYPALAGCDLRFSVSDGSNPAFTLDATTGLKGTGTVTAYNLSAAVATYEVTVSALGDCAGIPDASGAFVVVSTSYGGKGTAGGGSYKVDTFSGRVKFAHVVQVRTVTSKVGKTSVITTTTKGSLLWTYKNVWRLKANLNYSSTDGSATYALVTCAAPAFSGGVAPTGFTGKCGQFSGAALLQVYDADAGAWIASDYTKVTFVATVYDGGTKSVCSKNRCTTTEYPDWFGVTIKANNVPLGPSTSPDGVPTSLLRSLASPDGNGSLKAN